MGLVKEILKECGLTFDEVMCFLDENPEVFSHKMQEKIAQNDFDIKIFMKELSILWDEFDRFSIFYNQTQSKKHKIIQFRSGLHLMLSVPELQTSLYSIILEKMIKYHISMGIDPVTLKSVAGEVISQFRWIGKLENGEILLNHLFDFLESLDESTISDVIVLFPEIFDVRYHDRLAQELKNLLGTNATVSSTIYYVLGCLTLSNKLIIEIQQEAIELLALVPIENVHLIIKFLVQNIKIIENPNETIQKIRDRLLFDQKEFIKNESHDQLEFISKNWDNIEYGMRYITMFPLCVFNFLKSISLEYYTNIDLYIVFLLYCYYDENSVIKSFFPIDSFKYTKSLSIFEKTFSYAFQLQSNRFLEFMDHIIHLKNYSYREIYSNFVISVYSFIDSDYKEVIFKHLLKLLRAKDVSISVLSVSIISKLSNRNGSDLIKYVSELIKYIKYIKDVNSCNLLLETVISLSSSVSYYDSTYTSIHKLTFDMIESRSTRFQKIGISGFVNLFENACCQAFYQKEIRDSQYSNISKLFSIFYTPQISPEVRVHLYDSIYSFIAKTPYEATFFSHLTEFFKNEIESRFVVKKFNDLHSSVVEMGKNSDKYINFTLGHKASKDDIFCFLNASNILKIIYLIYEKNKTETIKEDLKNIIFVSILKSRISFIQISQYSTISWLIEVINCHTEISSKEEFERVLFIFFENLTEIINYFIKINIDFWHINSQKSKPKKNKSMVKNQKSKNLSDIDAEDNEKVISPIYEEYVNDNEVDMIDFNKILSPTNLPLINMNAYVQYFEFWISGKTSIYQNFIIINIFNLQLKKYFKDDTFIDLGENLKIVKYLIDFISNCEETVNCLNTDSVNENVIPTISLKSLYHIVENYHKNKKIQTIYSFLNNSIQPNKEFDNIIQKLLFLKNRLTDLCFYLNVIKICLFLNDFSNSHNSDFESTFGYILKNEWGIKIQKGSEISKLYFTTLKKLMKIYDNETRIDKVELLIESGLSSTCDENKVMTITTLNLKNFGLFYGFTFSCLDIILCSLHKSEFDSYCNNLLNILSFYKILFQSTNKFNSRDILKICMTSGMKFVRYFSNNYLSIFEKIYAQKTTEIEQILKCFQKSTRFLQHIIRHAKVKNDNYLRTWAPELKKLLEKFIYRVKIMINKSETSSCQFWVGQLKNRDIYGVKVFSQQVDE